MINPRLHPNSATARAGVSRLSLWLSPNYYHHYYYYDSTVRDAEKRVFKRYSGGPAQTQFASSSLKVAVDPSSSRGCTRKCFETVQCTSHPKGGLKIIELYKPSDGALIPQTRFEKKVPAVIRKFLYKTESNFTAKIFLGGL